MRIGHKIFHFTELTSTQDKCLELVKTNLGEGFVVIADVQTQGRGRFNRVWLSPKGGLWFSIPFISYLSKIQKFLAPISAISICEAISTLTNLDAKICWPNDVFIRGKKIGGILIEKVSTSEVGDVIILGIGINLNIPMETFPDDLKNTASSVMALTGEAIDQEDFFNTLIRSLNIRYQEILDSRIEEICVLWKQKSMILGNRVKIQLASEKGDLEFEGRVIDIDIQQGLFLQLDTSVIRQFQAESIRNLYF